ncbi:hypothetical protein BC628DRAFT_23824 [Trametes gibbosa]|nr:hypothetical protein BC628DRAFT_23824 [Trametes gibbosa]
MARGGVMRGLEISVGRAPARAPHPTLTTRAVRTVHGRRPVRDGCSRSRLECSRWRRRCAVDAQQPKQRSSHHGAGGRGATTRRSVTRPHPRVSAVAEMFGVDPHHSRRTEAELWYSIVVIHTSSRVSRSQNSRCRHSDAPSRRACGAHGPAVPVARRANRGHCTSGLTPAPARFGRRRDGSGDSWMSVAAARTVPAVPSPCMAGVRRNCVRVATVCVADSLSQSVCGDAPRRRAVWRPTTRFLPPFSMMANVEPRAGHCPYPDETEVSYRTSTGHRSITKSINARRL